MGHFWQNLGFENFASDEEIAAGANGEPANFDQNVRNLITGQTPLYRARGDSLPPALLNAEDDNTIAAIMVPAYDEENYYFAEEVQEMQEIVQRLIPGVYVMIKPYVPLTEEEEEGLGNDDTVRGQTMFEYDPDADGQGNGDWRLWYEQFSERGRALGQNVVP